MMKSGRLQKLFSPKSSMRFRTHEKLESPELREGFGKRKWVVRDRTF